MQFLTAHQENITSPVLKLYISPIIRNAPIQFSAIEHYFSRFGEIACWDYKRGTSADFYVVQFKHNDDVKKILVKRYHRIKNYIITVDKQEAPLVNEAFLVKPAHFLHLSDNQLHKVFSSVNVNDLATIASTCVRFKNIADCVFASKYNKITWRVVDPYGYSVFRAFGHLTKSLDVDVLQNLDEVVSRCQPKHLRNLQLWIGRGNHTISADSKSKMMQILSQLVSLDIYCNKFFDVVTTVDLLSSCEHLESLAINCTTGDNWVFNNLHVKFPMLKSLTFYFNSSIDDYGLQNLLQHNPTIRKLFLDQCPLLKSKSMAIIAQHAPNLEELALGFSLQHFKKSDLKPLHALKKLKRLTVVLGPAMDLIDTVREAKLPIEGLVMWYTDINDALITKITQIKTIRMLAFYSNQNTTETVQDHQLCIIAKKLTNLTDLRLVKSKVTMEGLGRMLMSGTSLTQLRVTEVLNEFNKARFFAFVTRNVHKRNLTVNVDGSTLKMTSRQK